MTKRTTYVTPKNLAKFILCSGLGILIFLIPVPYQGAFTTLLEFVKSFISRLFGSAIVYILTALLIISAVLSVFDYFFKPNWIRNNRYLSAAFSTTPLYIFSKLLGAVFVVMTALQIGPACIVSPDTGGTMLDLCCTLICIVLSFSFLMPFLTDCGSMEFLGVILKPIIRPLFRVPGRSAVDLIASWFGSSNAAAILTREQYMKGFYTKREAGYIMTNFSLVSVPFCLLVANTIGISSHFPLFYLTLCIVGVILAAILIRIPPISWLPDTYRESIGKQLDEDVPLQHWPFRYALESSCKRAETFTVHTVITGGLDVVVGMLFDLIPIVMSWGTLALIIANYTPFFDIISYPMALYLKLLGVEEAIAVAPAALIGFTDMFIPALIIKDIVSVKTRFIMGALSLIQIIYLTEVGAVIIKSEVPLGLGKLFLIFMERTLLSLPLFVLCARLFL